MEIKGTGKCPNCGSWDVWVTLDKPPSCICKKCGYQFALIKPKPEEES